MLKVTLALIGATILLSSHAWAKVSDRFYDEQISVPEMVQDLKASGSEQDLKAIVGEYSAKISQVTGLSEDQVMAMFQAALAQVKIGQPFRFPVVPVQMFAKLNGDYLRAIQPLLPSASPSAPQAPKPDVSEEIQKLLTACPAADKPNILVQPPEAAGVHPVDWENFSLTDCDRQKSQMLADVLNRTSNTDEFLQQLLKSGHTVTLTLERTVADFLGLGYKNKSVILPFWVNTGYKLADGSDLVVPSGHTQWTWHITGPALNANARFFLGIDGIGFWADDHARPRWTGFNRTNVTNTREAGGRDLIAKSWRFAQGYVKRGHLEGQGLFKDGYGYTGVCNDSVAEMEKALFGGVSVYPVIRNLELRQKGFPSVEDGLDQIFNEAARTMPVDYQVSDANRRDVFSRILQMRGKTAGNLFQIDSKLKADVEAVETEVSPK
jgi:hypothetical protein